MRPFIAALLLLAGPALAAEPTSKVVATAGWARASAGAATTGAAYLTLTDSGAPDRLTGASTPVASRAEVHETVDDQGVMRMRPVPAVDLPPGVPVTLAPGGCTSCSWGSTAGSPRATISR